MTTVKITELSDIGANLASSTVVPVVNMAGTPITQKTNVGNIANLILEGAGVDYAEATVALLAQTVSNAAQPNITSVGTLTNVVVSGNATVNGNITSNGTAYVGNLSTTGLASITTLNVGTTANLGAVGNVKITGGTIGQILSTDGAGNLSWTSDTTTYGNSNVVSLLSAFGSNTITTTGNISGGNINIPNGYANVTGTANIVGGGATVATKSVLNVASTFGSNDANDPASAQAVRGRVTGANLTKTRNYVTGVTGQYLVTGTNASEFIKAGVLGVVGDQTTTADGAVVAYLDGDGGLTTANAAYAVSMKNSTPNSGFNYGLDLQFINLNLGGVTTSTFKQADIRFNNGVTLVANTAGNISINGNLMTSAEVVASGVIQSGTGLTTGGYLSVDGNTDLHNTLVTGNLSATGNITANNLGNISAINLTGSNSNVLYGNGVFAPASGGNSTYGDSNVVSLLSAFGPNTITTTGNVSVGNIIGNGQALTGITGANVGGFVPNANVANTAFAVAGANVSGFVPNANVANTAFAVAAANVSGLGNIATLNLDGNVSNLLTGNGTYVAIPTVPTVGNIATLNLDGNVSNLLTGNGTYVAIPVVPTVGNIATINLTGSNANVLYGNGVFAAVAGGNANTGNVTFDDNIVIGTGDEFGGGGLYLAVGPNSIANSAVQYLRVRGGDAPTHIHLDTGNNQFYDQYFGDDAKYVKLELGDAGNVVIGTDDANGNLYSWSFTSDGNLILADGNSVIQSIANSSLDPVNPNVSTMVLTPDPGYGSQALVLDPTAPGHIHLRAPGANIDEPSANIFLGGEDSSFEVGHYNGAAPNVFVHSGGNTWTFGTDGILTFPDNLVIAGNTSVFGTNAALITSAPDQPLITLSSGANGAVSSLWVEDIGNVGTSNIAAVYANPASGSKIVRIAVGQNGVGSGPNLWDFGATGNLTLPGNTFAVNYANGTQVSLGGNVSNIINGNSNVNIATANGNVTIAAVGNTTMTITGTGANVTGTFNATGNITSGNISTGVITLTNGAVIKDTAGDSVSFGQGAGANTQGNSAVAIGLNAGNDTQGTYAVAVGLNAGSNTQGNLAVAIGVSSGSTNQGNAAVAIGVSSGSTNQGNAAVAIGQSAGSNTQGLQSVAIGVSSGYTNQGNAGVAIGTSAGYSTQSNEAVAIGAFAGEITQGTSAVAIGSGAGRTSQGNNSIILNATGANLNQTTANTFTVAPVRNDTSNIAEVMFYNATSKEVTYGNTISVAGNVSGTYLISTHASANEGGEISLAQPPNGNLSGGITIDAYQNTLRMFEQGGTSRGLSVDIANSPAGGGTAIGYRDIPQVAAGNVTLGATDAGKHYYSTTAGNLTLTIPLNSSVPFTTGTAISIVVQAAGNILVNAASGVTLYMAGNSTAANRAVGGYGMATLMKVATDTWFINGTGVA